MTLNTINIKGKEYVPVNERLRYFAEYFKNGSIRTELVSSVEADNIVIKAIVYPDTENMERYFTGYSQATVGDGYINKTSALENAETSAVGRALGMMGIGINESVASPDEVEKAIKTESVKNLPFSDAPIDCEAEGCTYTNLPRNTIAFSQKVFGKTLCYIHQQEEKKKQK